MIFNERKPSKKKQLTWVINSSANLLHFYYSPETIAFTSNGKKYAIIQATVNVKKRGFLTYFTEGRKDSDSVAYGDADSSYWTWSNEAFRTLVFDESPTGTMLAWLQANATPQ